MSIPHRLLITLALAATTCGCLPAPSTPEVNLLTASPEPLCRIAVLPLINTTKYQQGGTIVSRILSGELNRRGGFTLAQEGDVRRLLRQMQIAPKESPNPEQRRVLAERLGVEAIVVGEIITMHEEVGSPETNPQLALNLQLWAVDSKRPLITTYYSRRGADYRTVMHFGLINTMTSLAVKMADEIIEIWQAKGVKSCAS